MSLNFYQAIKPMLMTSKIFRTISFQFGNKGYKISKLNVYLNIILSLAYLALFVYGVYQRKDHLFYSVMVTTTDVMQLAVTALLVITTWLFSARYQKRSITILLRLLQLDKEMRKLGVWISYDKLNRFIYIQILVRFVLIILIFAFQAATKDFTSDKQSLIYIVVILFLFHMPIVVNTATCLEVSVYITILRSRFQTLNEHLTALETNTNNFLRDDIKIIKLTTFLGTKLKMLRVVCPLHHELSKIAEIVNERFGVVLLMSFLNTFVATVVNLYFCSTVWQEDNISEYIGTMVGAVLSCMTYILETIYICYMCNTTVEEANKSGTLIHKIDTDDNDVKDQIEMFSLQIAHKRVEFSAAGLFPINYTLLFSIVGGVTTNLVILIQFSAN